MPKCVRLRKVDHGSILVPYRNREGCMKTITLKGIPEGLYQELRRRAEAQRRSLNAEVLFRLELSVASREPAAAEMLARINKVRERIKLPYLPDEELRAARREGRE